MTGIAYIDGRRFRKSLVAGSAHVRGRRGELDRINVFPVPDGDTGTNLALTLDAVSERVAASTDRSLSAVASVAAEGAVLGARGNSGMLLSHFLLGLAEGVGDHERLDPGGFARAVAAGADAVGSALEVPVEGTILTVIRDTAVEVGRNPGGDFVPWLERMVEAARASLARTPELLPVLSRAGVVDAGAQGFVHLLEGVLRLVRGEGGGAEGAEGGRIPSAADDPAVPSAAALTAYPEASERFHFCTEALLEGLGLPSREEVRARLGEMGDSLIVIRSGTLLKVHIHTDDPEGVFAVLEGWGRLEARKVDDMRAQHDAVERGETGHVTLARRPVAVVTDSACDLPDEMVRAHDIRVVPLELVEGGRTLRDRVDVSAEAFHARLGDSGPLPTTSQPSPAAFLEAFRDAAGEAESIVGVFVGSTLSGTLASARSASTRLEGVDVHLADSLGASLLEGMLALKAAELAERGWTGPRIVEEVVRVRQRSGIVFTVQSFDRLIASGRVSLGRAFLGRVLGLKPILGVDPDGKTGVVGKAIGLRRARAELLAWVEEGVGTAGRVRFGVVHVGAPAVVPEISEWLRARYGPETEILSAPATPVIATHLGVGAWGVAWMVEDGEGVGAG